MAGTYDIAVVGGGIAGLTAAHHAALAGASVVHAIGTDAIGGLVLNVGQLEGYPAGPAPLSGLDLATGLMEAAAALGVDQQMEEITSIARDARGYRLATPAGELRAGQVIAATGARLRTLDVPGARELAGRGVSQCAWCDATLYRGRHVAVVGGGDAALEAAWHLARIVGQVTLVTRGDALRARRAYVNRIADCDNVAFQWLSDVREVIGRDRVEGLSILDREQGAETTIACDGVFVLVGVTPASALVSALVEIDPAGGVVTDAHMQTGTPGLFAIGALRSGFGGRLVHAVSDAATAAVSATAAIDA